MATSSRPVGVLATVDGDLAAAPLRALAATRLPGTVVADAPEAARADLLGWSAARLRDPVPDGAGYRIDLVHLLDVHRADAPQVDRHQLDRHQLEAGAGQGRSAVLVTLAAADLTPLAQALDPVPPSDAAEPGHPVRPGTSGASGDTGAPAGPTSIATLDLPRYAVESAARTHLVSTDDVLLCALAGGLRELFAAAGEPLSTVTVQARLTDSGTRTATGGLSVVRWIPLPINQSHAAQRLATIAAITRADRQRPIPARAGTGRAGLPLPPVLPVLARLFTGSRPASVSPAQVDVLTVHGGHRLRRLAGLALTSVRLLPGAPVVSQQAGRVSPHGERSVSVAVLSYLQTYAVTVQLDRIGPAEVLVDAMRRTVETLVLG